MAQVSDPDTFGEVLDLVPTDGYRSPAAQFLIETLIALDGILDDADLLAAARKTAGAQS